MHRECLLNDSSYWNKHLNLNRNAVTSCASVDQGIQMEMDWPYGQAKPEREIYGTEHHQGRKVEGGRQKAKG